MALQVCPACGRHARESACPFCGASIAANPTASTSIPRVARIALVGLGAAAVVAACGDGTTQIPAYGLPPSDAQSDAPLANDAAYGGPPFDASLKDQSVSDASSDATTDGSDE